MGSEGEGQATQGRPQLFAVKVASGQEANVARLVANRVQLKGLGILSIIVSPKMKGYVVVEADSIAAVNDAISGIKNIKSVVPGVLSYADVERLVLKKKEAVKLAEGDLVEVTSGPFKGMKARVIRFSEEKQEATINLVDVPYQLQVTVDANYLKKSTGSG
ncbi:MAG: transcription elongation factor Spt5 [Desulfurococcaceae archaeon]